MHTGGTNSLPCRKSGGSAFQSTEIGGPIGGSADPGTGERDSRKVQCVGLTPRWGSDPKMGCSLTYYDSVRDVTWNDWRLPSSLNQDGSGPCEGYNCTDSEFGHLFYVELGAVAGSDIGSGTDLDVALFTNFMPGGYSTNTLGPDDPNQIWWFDIYVGNQGSGNRLDPPSGYWPPGNYAWAVRDGDVAVPKPTSLLLLGTGLVGMLVLKRNKH